MVYARGAAATGGAAVTRPRVFLGSASETKHIVDALESALRQDATIKRWDLDVFRPGRFILEELTKEGDQVDFAVFVVGQDDKVVSRGDEKHSPRDNVIFEAGLFTAALGRERTFYVVDKDGTKLPSDWAGLGHLQFDKEAQEPRDKVYDAAEAIRKQMSLLGPLKTAGPLGGIVGPWWQYIINVDEGSVLSLMEISTEDGTTPVVRGNSWSTEGAPHAQYKSQCARYDGRDRTLHYAWEGEHPRVAGRPRFFGIGEVTFEPGPGASASRGTGWYSISAQSNVQDALLKSAMYVRASPEDVAILKDGDPEDRASLVQARLAERKLLPA